MPLLLSLRSQRTGLFAVLLVYFVVAGLFAVLTPAWQAPDEPAHYNYIAQVARDGCCPKIEPADWDSAYLEQLKSSHFAPETLGNLLNVQYEDHQPPLYYLLQAPVFSLTGGSLVALRLFSVLMGAGIVLCTFATSIVLMPDRPQVALGAAALLAFLPQHVAVVASVNNDSLSNLIIAMTLLACVLYMKGQDVRPWQFGLLVGLGMLTKVSTLILVPLVCLTLLLRWWQLPPQVRWYRLLARMVAYFAVPVLVLGGIWWVHSMNVYGFPDLFGLRQHDRVVTDQPRTADLIAQIGFGQYLGRAVQTSFNSFWGQFGWMALPLPDWMYRVILGLMVICLSGVAVQNFVRDDPPAPDAVPATKRIIWLLPTALIVLAVLAYFYYNTVFLQLQGRYMFTGLIAFAIVMSVGLDAWRGWVADQIPALVDWLLPYLVPLVFSLFAALDVYLLLRVIVPGLRP